jgi:hypothetical protein
MPTTSTATTKRSPQSILGGTTDAGAEGAPDAPATEASAWQDDPQMREALIRLAAYSFYERRGFIEGHELEDWLQAEMEIDRRAAAGAGADGSGPALN